MSDSDTNETKEEIKDIKKMLRQVLEILQQVYDIEQDIKMYEGRQTQQEQKIANAMKKKRFSSIFEWKNAIWERCPNKKEQVGTNMVSFYCSLLKGPCKFEDCPRNLVDTDPYSYVKQDE